MVAVKRITAAEWAALTDDDVIETEDLYASLGAGTYRIVRADLASVTIPALTAGAIDQVSPNIGDTLTVSGAVVGSTPVYRWQKSATNAFAGEETDIAGATGASLDTSSGVTADDYVRRGVQDEGPQAEVFTASVQVAAAATVPAQMSAPSLTVISATEISVDRAAAPDDGGSAITSYDLQWQEDGGSWTLVTGISDPQSITGLTASTLYYVQTRAVNAVGAGAWSASASDTTQAGAGALFEDDFTSQTLGTNLTDDADWNTVSGDLSVTIQDDGGTRIAAVAAAANKNRLCTVVGSFPENRKVTAGVHRVRAGDPGFTNVIYLNYVNATNYTRVERDAGGFTSIRHWVGGSGELSQDIAPTEITDGDDVEITWNSGTLSLKVNGVHIGNSPWSGLTSIGAGQPGLHFYSTPGDTVLVAHDFFRVENP